jgi:hypothetical protein
VKPTRECDLGQGGAAYAHARQPCLRNCGGSPSLTGRNVRR